MKTTIGIGVILGIIRIWMGFNVETESFAWSQAYKDAAHLFMGGLAVVMWQHKEPGITWRDGLFWGLCVLEVAAAVLSRVLN